MTMANQTCHVASESPRSQPRTPSRMTAAAAEPLTRTLSPFTVQGLRRLSMNKHPATLSPTQSSRKQRDLVKAKTFVTDDEARISCTSHSAENKLGDHELLLCIRFLFLLDGSKWAKVDAGGHIPNIYYDLVACLHTIHSRYFSPAQSESHHPYPRFLFPALRSARETLTESVDT